MFPYLRRGPSGFSSFSTAEEVTEGIDKTGQTAIVTGSSSGIGAETSRILAKRGVHVILAVRNVEAGLQVKESIKKEIPKSKIDVLELDLTSIASIRRFSSDFNSLNLPLDILVNNAGVFGIPNFTLSADGIEMTFATNHLGHFLLTELMLEKMKDTTRRSNIEGRIINVSSLAYLIPRKKPIAFDTLNDKSRYGRWQAYSQSKLANLLHTNELARRFKRDGVNIAANSVHPGFITSTNLVKKTGLWYGIGKAIFRFIGKNIQQGAATTCYVALHPKVEGVSGKFFQDCNVVQTTTAANDEVLAKKLWDFSSTCLKNFK